jgi:hypothetical protein
VEEPTVRRLLAAVNSYSHQKRETTAEKSSCKL